jgi:hypothetical protein
MHLTASPPWEGLVRFVDRLPVDLDLNSLARTNKAVQRCRGNGVEDGTTLLRLCLARGPGGKSLQETAAAGHLVGGPLLLGVYAETRIMAQSLRR